MYPKNSDGTPKYAHHLLSIVKKTNWDDEEYKRSNRGRKPKPKENPKIDFNNPRNKSLNNGKF